MSWTRASAWWPPIVAADRFEAAAVVMTIDTSPAFTPGHRHPRGSASGSQC